MTWIKQGRIFWLDDAPNRSNHAQVPTPLVMEDKIRVYYSCRNNGKSFIAYFDLAKDLKTVLKAHEQPVMEIGKPGMFDADGTMPSCIVEYDNELWLYYIGWNELSSGARYHNEIGLAVSKDSGETFTRMFDGPIIGRSTTEPGLAVMPFIYKGDFLFPRMWYQSLVNWHIIDGQYEPVYVIKYARSEDGIEWERDNRQCVKSEYPLEAFSRPSIMFDDDNKYKMWFCTRDSNNYRNGEGAYRIHYAESEYGIEFERKGACLELGEDGDWDSEMTAYPYVFDVDGRRVMLYNGNGFGQTGIGLAIWK